MPTRREAIKTAILGAIGIVTVPFAFARFRLGTKYVERSRTGVVVHFGQAGEPISCGQAVYFGSDGKVHPASASDPRHNAVAIAYRDLAKDEVFQINCDERPIS